jgi:putative ABC transport system ATP-binding protein
MIYKQPSLVGTIDMLEPTNASDGDDMSFIEMERVRKSFRSGGEETVVLRDLDMQVEEGEMVVVMGPSGSGKTTLLNLLGGIDRPDSGIVQVVGARLESKDERGLGAFRRSNVGFIFQFYNLIPTLTAMENVLLGMEIRQRIRKEDEAQARKYLGAVGLSDRESFLPQQLSAGQQQRVAIARALAKRPRLVLADEPTGNLDEERAAQVMRTMKSLQEEERITFVIVSHNLEMRAHADRVLRLRAGKLEA